MLATAAPAGASTVVSWEYDQLAPAICYGAASQAHLVVWEDHHWGSGNDWDIYGRFVGDGDTPIGTPFDITPTYTNKQLAPDVAYNPGSGEFLVVWEDEFSTADHDIYAQRIGSSGTPIGGRITITTSTNREGNPAVAYNAASNEFLIVWERRTGSDEFAHEDIYGQRVSAAGTLAGTSIPIDTSLSDQLAPTVACAPAGECLVVWQDHDSSADFDIRGRRVGSDGTPLGSKIAISTWEYDQLKPRLAFNGSTNQFLVVWEDHHWGFGADWDIYGQRINVNGTLAGSNFAISWLGTNHRESPDVAYHGGAREYLVVWEYEFSATDHDVYRRRVAGDGTLPDDEIAVSSLGSHERRPAVAAGSIASHLIAWEDSRNTASQGVDIYAALAELPLLSGYVYAGSVGVETTPIGNVPVTLYCSTDAGSLGTSIASTTSDLAGRYGLIVTATCNFYSIVETDLPGYSSVGATTVSGTVINSNRIQYSGPLTGKTLSGNKFWDANPLPTAAITAPTPGAVVAGAVPVIGTANDSDIYGWVLRYGPGATPPAWTTISFGSSPVINATLGTWNTVAAGLPDGLYTLQLQVTDGAAQTTPASVSVTVDNTAPIAVVTSPSGGAMVSGLIPVMGTATDTHLSSWILEYGAGASPAAWTAITTGSAPVINGLLGNWSATGLPDGNYTLRLRVTDLAANNSQYPVGVVLASPTSTPTLTPTRIATPVSTATTTPTRTATQTHTTAPTATLTPTTTATQTTTRTNTPTSSPTQSHTASFAATASATPTRTATMPPSASATTTASRTATHTPSATETSTSTPSLTPTNTTTPSRTATAGTTHTPTATATRTPTGPIPTASPSRSATFTPTMTATSTQAPTVTATRTPALTWTPTPTSTPQPTVAPTCGLSLGRWLNYGSGTPGFPTGYPITSATVDGQERLWIGTLGGGIASYDGILWTRHTVASTASGLLSDEVSVVAADGDEIWVGTSSGVSRLDSLTATWSTYTTANSGLPHNTVRAIAFADTGSPPNIRRSQFFATGNGLAQHFKSGASDVWSVATTANSGLAHNVVLDVAVTRTNTYWIVTRAGVNRVAGTTWTTFTNGNTPGCGVIESATRVAVDDAGGRVWFGTDRTGTIDPQAGLGACMFDTATAAWRHFHSGNSGLSTDTVKDVVVDTIGRIWFGTAPFLASNPAGVSVCTWAGNDCYWRSYGTADGLASKRVSAVAASLDRLWFGTEDAGLSSFSPNWGFYDTDGVLALASLPGHVWAGTGVGLRHFDGNTWTTQLAGLEVRSILAPSLTDVWAGTAAGGVRHWDGVNWTTYNTTNSGLASNRILALVRDTRDRIWIGTEDAGASVYNLRSKAWATFKPANSPLPSNRAAALTIDSSGQIWIGTDNGLAHFTGKSWTVYTATDGLPSADIRGLGATKSGHVWAATSAGAARWDGTAWTPYVAPADIGGANAVALDAAGAVWLGGSAGAAVEDGAGGRLYRARNSGLINDGVRAISVDDGCAWFGTLHRFGSGGAQQGGLFVRGVPADPLGAPVPAINGFSPSSGTAGSSVTISGASFDPRGPAYNTVEFRAAGFDHWAKAIVVSANATQVSAKVPVEAMRGPIRVRTGGGTAVSSGVFEPIPTISKLSVTSGVPGIPVDIFGANFNSPSGTVDVRFGNSGWITNVTPEDHHHIEAYVPADATTGPIQVRNSGGTATSPAPFAVIAAGGLVTFGYEVTQGHPCFLCVAGKSTAVRVFVGSSSASSPAYVGRAVLRVWRAGVPLFTVDASPQDGGVPNQGFFANTTKQFTRDGSIDFFIPGSKLPASPSFYTFEVEIYAGPMLLKDEHFGNAYQFADTYPIRIHAAAPGPAPWGQQLTLLARNLTAVARAFPVRDGYSLQIGGLSTGVQVAIGSYNECDGSATGHCKGTGFLWDFWQQNAAGQRRTLIEEGATIGDPPDDGDKVTVNIGTVPKGGSGKLRFLGRLRPASAFPSGMSLVNASVSIDTPDTPSTPDWFATTSVSVVRPATPTSKTTPPAEAAERIVAEPPMQPQLEAPALRVLFDRVRRVKMWDGDPMPNPPNPGDVMLFEIGYQNAGTAESRDTVIIFDYDQAHMAMYGGGGLVRGTGGTIETQLLPGQFWAGTGFTGDRHYDCPLDENYDGVIDASDLPSYAVEFDHWNPLTGDITTSTDFTKLAPGDVIRNFRDLNHNGRADEDEPVAPYVERVKNLPQLLFTTPTNFFADYNKTHPLQKADVSALWFWGDGRIFRWPGNAWDVNYILGPGQGNALKQFWAEVPSHNAMVHELGHVFGQVKQYSPHSTPAGHTTNQLVPLPYAYDTLGRRVITGDQLLSVMWWLVQRPIEDTFFEPFEYFDMFGTFRYQAQASGSAAGDTQLLYISGSVTSDTVLISSSYLAENLVPTPADESSAYRLRFVAGDRVLGEHRFPLSVVEYAQHADQPLETAAGAFSIVQPFPAGTTAAEIWHDSSLLTRMRVSDTAPWVQVLTPNGSESTGSTGDLVVTWSAGDADGDDLTYAVRYSADGGGTWRTLMAGSASTQLRTPLGMLPGSNHALIEVEASDGFRTARDRSDAPFSVGKKPPLWAEIVAPPEGARRVQSEPVTLAGSSYDPEDGMLPDDALRWASSLDGLLGNGSSLSVFLTAGRHELTLTATDADGQSTQSTATIDVLADFDADGLDDVYEQEHAGLEWWNPDGTADLDNDGLSNRGECDWKTDPGNPDSDGDGVPDGDEVAGGSLPGISTSVPQPAVLMASRTRMDLIVPAGGPNPPATEILLLSSTPQTLSWRASVSASGLSIDPASGTTPAVVRASVDVTGFAPGHYQGELTFRSDSSEHVVEVHLDVVQPAITPSPTPHPTLTFAPTPTPSPTPTLTPLPCTGDCGLDGTVTIEELIVGVNIALGFASVTECESFDVNHDQVVTIDELTQAVNAALAGCS